MSTEIEMVTLPAVRERSAVMLMPVMDVQTAMARLREFQEFISSYLQESRDGGNDGGDYGVIPGTKKKTLLKSGADKLCEVYGLYDEYEISPTIDWTQGLFDYEVKCILKSRRDDSTVGSGLGSCSSFESKYRWRDAKRACPQCGQPTIIKGKDQYGGGYICWKKEGKSDGCGAKFKDGDPEITNQVIGRIDNPDIVDIKNTVLKMAKKRAKIDAVIGVTRSSGIFSQDMEDFPPAQTLKPPVPVTTEDIEIGGSAPSGDDKPSKGPFPSKAPETIDVAALNGELVDEGQAVNFHRMFKDSLPPAKRKFADELAHEFLRQEGIKDVLDKPSAKAIRKDSFFDVREKAMEWARGQK